MHFDDARRAVANGTTPEDAARDVVAGLTPQERLWCLDGDGPTWAGLRFLGEDGYHLAPFPAARVERVGIPGIAFSDGPRGAVVGNATAFPVSMARGSTWDPELEERVGEAIGRELRAIGANLTGAVCVNILRHPAWGRAQETYGEDPHHVGELGAAFTRGLQRHVMACVKHFACNSMENARFQVDIEVDEVALHEVYLPHFKRIIDEGAASVMSAYNSVNGEWAGESPALLDDVLRDEWGFQGFVISDWIFGLRDAATSIAAGLDIEMPYRMIRQQHLEGALESGAASWADVDRSVERIVATLLRFDPILSVDDPPADVLCSPDHRALAREVAARSALLLRNESIDGAPVLPLAAGSRVAVVGPLADVVNIGDGGSSDVWDLDCVTVRAGLADVFDVVDDPATADAAVVVVGYTLADEGEFIGSTDPSLPALFPPGDETEVVERFNQAISDLPPTIKPDRIAERPQGFGIGGDRTSLRLNESDVELIRTVSAANRRTIVVVQAGSAVVISEWVDDVAGVVQAWYGGSQAGPGLADVLTGVVNPSARLPFSVPSEEADLPEFDRDATSFTYDRWHGWWHLQRIGRPAAFPFGFGLSYTTFEIDETAVATSGDGPIVVTGVVRNTGDCDGADVIQVYADLPDADAPDRLVAFARVVVQAGASSTFRIEIARDRFATRDPQRHAWSAPSGRHRIAVARHADDHGAATHEVDL